MLRGYSGSVLRSFAWYCSRDHILCQIFKLGPATKKTSCLTLCYYLSTPDKARNNYKHKTMLVLSLSQASHSISPHTNVWVHGREEYLCAEIRFPYSRKIFLRLSSLLYLKINSTNILFSFYICIIVHCMNAAQFKFFTKQGTVSWILYYSSWCHLVQRDPCRHAVSQLLEYHIINSSK